MKVQKKLREKKTFNEKNFYDTIQQDMEDMIELYQNNLVLLKQIKDKVEIEKESSKDEEIEIIKELIYRTEYFAYQLKSNVPKADRPI